MLIPMPVACPWEMFSVKTWFSRTIVSQSSPTKDLTNPHVFLMPTVRVFTYNIYIYIHIYLYIYICIQCIFIYIYIIIKVVYVRFTATQ